MANRVIISNIQQFIGIAKQHSELLNIPAFTIVVFVGFMLYLGTKDSKRLNNILVFIKMTKSLICWIT